MRSKLFAGILGVALALLLVAVAGAGYGALAGIPIYGPEYGHLRGVDGALLGVVAFLTWGGLPAVGGGAVGGILVATRKESASDSARG